MRSVFVVLIGLVLFVSCEKSTVFTGTKALPDYWDKDEVLEFSLPEMDSLKKYNMFLEIRNDNDYPFNNLFIIANLKFPHGKTVTDTLEYRMAEADGSWLGNGIGTIKDNKLWYKENVSFFEKGTYTLSLSQAVRNNGKVEGVSQLKGITDVGYSIEEANTN